MMQPYYDYFDYNVWRGASHGKIVTVPAELHQLPLFIRGGSIIPTRERPRRSSSLMKRDPFTLVVAVSKDGTARGELYLDDGETFAHRSGALVWREFTFVKGRLSSRDLAGARPDSAVDGVQLAGYSPSQNDFASSIRDVRVERIVVVGLEKQPKGVKVEGAARDIWHSWTGGVGAKGKKEGTASKLMLKDPKVKIVEYWDILFE